MNRRIHGGDTYGLPGPILDFSANINPLGMPDSAKAALAKSIASWEWYPDPLSRELTQAIANFEGVDPNWVYCANGAAEIVFRLMQVKRPRKVLLTAPIFTEYERAVTAAGGKVVYHILRESHGFVLEKTILGQITSELDMVVLCNPNNPTGQSANGALMRRILKKCAACAVLLVVDECFISFLDDPDECTLRDSLPAYPNVILIKAFTKFYAMAGLRLGYLLCADRQLIDAIDACGQPWNVSMPAQIAGVAALTDTDYPIRTREAVESGRTYLMQELKKFDFTIYGSQANFIFFSCPVTDLRERMLKQGILIRSCADYRGLDKRFYRIAIRSREANEQFIRILTKVLS